MASNIGRYLQEHYTLSKSRYSLVSPGKYNENLNVGDVLLSKSGNARLILDINDNNSDEKVVFLTKLTNQKLQIEQALLEKVKASRLKAIVRDSKYDTIGACPKVTKNLSKHSTVLHNIEVMMGLNPLGISLSSSVVAKGSQAELADITMYVDQVTGKISNFNDSPYSDSEILVGLLINARNLPSFDYIKSAAFMNNTSDLVKKSIIFASIFANSVQNAINFHDLKSTVG